MGCLEKLCKLAQKMHTCVKITMDSSGQWKIKIECCHYMDSEKVCEKFEGSGVNPQTAASNFCFEFMSKYKGRSFVCADNCNCMQHESHYENLERLYLTLGKELEAEDSCLCVRWVEADNNYGVFFSECTLTSGNSMVPCYMNGSIDGAAEHLFNYSLHKKIKTKASTGGGKTVDVDLIINNWKEEG